MTYSSKTTCPDRVLPSTTVWFFQRETKQSLHTPHSTLHTALFALQTWNFTLHTSHFALLTSRFTRSSCKRQWYYACSHSTKQPWRSHYNAICRDWVAKHNRTTRNGVGNCSSKTGSRRQGEKKDDFEALFKRIFRRKITSAKMEQIC